MYTERFKKQDLQIDEDNENKQKKHHLDESKERYIFASQHISGNTLDAACGIGYGTNILSQKAKKVSAIDKSPEAIEDAKSMWKNNNITFQVMDIRKIEFPDNSFDSAISIETLEHINEQKEFLSELSRVLKKGATLVISTPNGSLVKDRFNPPNPFHKRELTKQELQELLENAGFSQITFYGQRDYIPGGSVKKKTLKILTKLDILKLRKKLISKNKLSDLAEKASDLDMDIKIKPIEQMKNPYIYFAVCKKTNIPN